jgi:hypothetical protein
MRLRKNDSVIAPEAESGVLYDSDKSKQTMRRPAFFVSTIVLFAVSAGYGLLLRPSRHADAVEHGNVRQRGGLKKSSAASSWRRHLSRVPLGLESSRRET